jgi:hypothetical protein
MQGGSIVGILNALRGKPIGQSPLVRVLMAAEIILCAVSEMAVAMVLDGVVGGVIEYVLMKIT